MVKQNWMLPTGCYKRGWWCGAFFGSAFSHAWINGLTWGLGTILFLTLMVMIAYYEVYELMEKDNGS